MHINRTYLIAGLAALATSCGVATVTPPAPPAPPPPAPVDTAVRVALTIRDTTRQPVPGLTCRLLPDTAAAVPCDTSGLQTFYTLSPAQIGHGAHLEASAEGWEPARVRVLIGADGALHDEHDRPFELTMTPVRATLPNLVPTGQFFRLASGEPFVWIGASEFNLLNRFRHGEDIEPVLAQLEAIGFNAVRVFTVYDICPTGQGCQAIGRSEPTPDLYAAIPGFSRMLARHGLYGELVAFTGPYGLLPSDDAKVQHWTALVSAMRGISNLTVELVNEYDHPANTGLPLARLERPAGVLASHGSATQDQTPLQPFWDYVTYRPGGGGEWHRKVGHNAWEIGNGFNVVTIANETTRVPDNEGSADRVFDAAAGATLFSAGAVFHSVSGKAAVPFGPTEEALARAWVAGARSVPLRCQGLPYRHLDDGPYLRVYQMGSDPACLLKIRR